MHNHRTHALTASVLALLVMLVSCLVHTTRAAHAVDDPAALAASAPLPSGPEGDLISYGRLLMTDSQKYLPQNINAGMSCAACHVDAGTKAHGGSFLGIYAKFPQWNKRAKRFITLQDRLEECFLYSMNGTPPAPYSREITAMTAYIAWLSRGAIVGQGFPNQGFVTVSPPNPPDATNGARIYAAQCETCHGADGAGNPTAGFPPLWGPKSFNDGAGMNTKMASFVRANMPFGKAGTLSDQEAADVSAFVLSHARPHFDRERLISMPSEPAGFF